MFEDLCLVQFEERREVRRDRQDPSQITVKINNQTVSAFVRC